MGFPTRNIDPDRPRPIIGRPRALKTPQEAIERIEEYFSECEAMGAPLLLHGLSLALGFTHISQLYEYEHKPDFMQIIQWAKQVVMQDAESDSRTARNPAGAIFTLKNVAGWQDAQRIEHAGHDGGPIELRNASDAELAALVDAVRVELASDQEVKAIKHEPDQDSDDLT